MLNEVWKEVPDTQGRYSVSTLGKVRRNAHSVVWMHTLRKLRTALLKPYLREGVRPAVCLRRNGGQWTPYVHKLVAITFIGPANGLVVNHKDGNPRNNKLSNLEYITSKQNTMHAHLVLGRSCRKLTNKQVRDVRSRVSKGETQASVAKLYDINPSSISRIISGEIKYSTDKEYRKC